MAWPEKDPPPPPRRAIADPVRDSGRHRALLTLFTCAVFLAAALLFVIQPMVGRMVLPRGGGSPQVWNTSLVFFQVMLLAGYVYAHFSVRWLGVRVQAAVHVAVLLIPFVALPIALPEIPPPDGNVRASWILLLLTASVGAPFFVLAAASPLLQRWFAATEHHAASDPYFLYAGSNAGSLAGLLAYPFVLEPLLPLSAQSRIWTIGYVGFVLLAVACVAIVVGWTRSRGGAPSTDEGVPDRVAPSVQDRLFWVAAAAVPSLLLMGVTQHLTSRIAPIPLLWVLPLAVYLLTFIVAFARRQVTDVPGVSRLLSFVVVALALVMLMRLSEPAWLITLLHLGVLAVAGLLCHMRLSARRPPAGHLTEFYLFIALGGALGGGFGALVAPWAFDQIAEYPIAVVLACLFRVPKSEPEEVGRRAPNSRLLRGRAVDLVAPGLVALYMLGGETAVQVLGSLPDSVYVLLLAVLPTLVCFFFSPRPLRYALGVAVLLTFAASGQFYRGDILLAERTFFGVYRVSRDPGNTVTIFYHGPTAHGVQSVDPALSGQPLAYYHPTGPAGRIMTAIGERPDKREIALVGAGTGALTALAGPHQHVTLYEIDPVVMQIAEDPRYFTFLRDAEASHEAVVADARIALARTTDSYDVMVMDAFSSGSIPVHLMTREAMELYLERLRPGGILLFHVSNRHLDLQPVLARHAAELDLIAFENLDVRDEVEQGIFTSHWVMMSRTVDAIVGLPGQGWMPMRLPDDAPLWTDDFSNLLTVLSWE